MPIFDYNGLKVNYLVEGKGEPILLLNGIMMTIQSWEPIAEPFRLNNTLIRVDLIDQGQTDKLLNQEYQIKDQADLVLALIKYLKYDQVNLVGISYGGYVAINFATRFPNYLKRLVLTNTAASVNNRDAEMFKQFIEVGTHGTPYAYYLTTIPLFYSPTFYEQKTDWMKERENLLVTFFQNQDYRNNISRLANSCLSHNCLNDLNKITTPTLIINGAEDYLLPLPRQIEILHGVKEGYLVSMYETGHVSIYENPVLYTSLLLGFINNPTPNYQI